MHTPIESKTIPNGSKTNELRVASSIHNDHGDSALNTVNSGLGYNLPNKYGSN